MRLVIDCFKLIKGTGKSIGIYNGAQRIVQLLGNINYKMEKNEIIKIKNTFSS